MSPNDNSEILLTQAGLDELKSELSQLKDVKRPDVLIRLTAAREKGDLSENAEYTTAKEELDMLDGRIDELEEIIKRAKVVKESAKKSDKVQIGTRITVSVKNQEHVFTVVGEWEADPKEKKISHDSPLGRALMGKREGEEVEVDAPVGKIMYQIKKIH